MNKDPKSEGLRERRFVKALEKEQTHIRQTLPDILAREASEIASKDKSNRDTALHDVRRRITHGQLAPFERAFFECLFEWLADREHRDAAHQVRAFIDAHHPPLPD
jgi:hypothetical protein